MNTRNIIQRIIGGLVAATLATTCISCSKSKAPKMTKEEEVFAEQWNKWVENHQDEMNALRTRAIADNMTEEETSKELIALMVRFSSESKLEIPQRFIDEIKKQGNSQKK